MLLWGFFGFGAFRVGGGALTMPPAARLCITICAYSSCFMFSWLSECIRACRLLLHPLGTAWWHRSWPHEILEFLERPHVVEGPFRSDLDPCDRIVLFRYYHAVELLHQVLHLIT